MPGVQLFGGKQAVEVLKLPPAVNMHHEYNSLACTVEMVANVQEAIVHIHQHGRYAEKQLERHVEHWCTASKATLLTSFGRIAVHIRTASLQKIVP